jgi:hypothetical protein
MSTQNQPGSAPSNVNPAGHAGTNMHAARQHTVPAAAARFRRRSAWSLCAGILLAGLTAHAAPQQAAPLTGQCSGDSFRIDLADAQDANLGQDPEERLEQLRDWVWPVLLARLEATAGLEGLLLGTSTQPLIRDDALSHVLDHPVGSTRSGIASDGTVVVMVQVEEPAAMQEALLEAIDQESLHLGAVPRQALVYRYAIDQRSGYAELCRLGSFDTRWIESQGQGFRRATVRKPRQLESFLAGGVDLLSAQCTSKGLQVTGRVRSRVRKAPMTAEHVASLYRPAKIQYVPPDQLGASLDRLSSEQAAWLTRVAFFVDNGDGRELARVRSQVDQDTWDMLVQARAWRARHPDEMAEYLLLSWIVQRKTGQDLGFSLDPKVHAADAARDLKALIAAAQRPVKLAALLHTWNARPQEAAALVELSAAQDLRALVERPLFAVWNELQGRSDHDAYGILAKAAFASGTPEEELAGAVVALVNQHSMYQCARYDGPLQGTQVGMTMFYTDLLMKLWSGDFQDSAPEGLVPGFESVIGHELSAAYCTDEERRYPNTRAWLGLREEQYARESAQRVRFAPVATRVFGRGSELGAGYSEEVEAGAEMRRFHRWWNAHYARVADWEPQYELLNQIMKWSVVVQSAAVADDQSCLAFLDQVTVERSHRFDRWVEHGKDLRWRGPVPLVKQGDEPTECLPMLQSRPYSACGRAGYLSGGVSAANKATIASKPVMRPRRAPELGQLDNMSPAAAERTPDGRLRYDAVPRADGKLTSVRIDPDQRSLQAYIDTAQSQRGARHGYATNGAVTGVKKGWHLRDGKLTGQEVLKGRGNSFGVGQLTADDVTQGAVRVQVKPEEGARMQALGKATADQLAKGKTLSRVAPDLPGVTEAVRIDDGRVLVKLAGADEKTPTHLLLSSGPGIRGPPRGRLTLSTGSPAGRGQESAVRVELLSEADANTLRSAAGAAPLPRGPQTRIAELERALADGDYATAERLHLYISPYDDADEARRALERAHLLAVREGKDTTKLEALQIRVRIRQDRTLGSVRESAAVPADAEVVIVPSTHAEQYPDLAALPGSVNPATPAGTARRAFHAQAISEAPTSRQLPAKVEVDGVDYEIVRRAARAAGIAGRMYLIRPCREQGEPESHDTVECEGRTAARQADEASRTALLRVACRDPEQAKADGVTDCRPEQRQ